MPTVSNILLLSNGTIQWKAKTMNKKLNTKQEKFCQIYASDREFFGNGTQSYIEAYGIKSRRGYQKTAQVNASRLLSNAMVSDRINEILEAKGLNDNFVDKQLSFLIAQHADLKLKLGAIREYNRLKQRLTEKIERNLPILIDDMFSALDDEDNSQNNIATLIDPNK